MSLRAAIAGNTPSSSHGGVIEQPVSHQFEDIDQQNECYIVGMWTFLVTEIMFFGAFFLAYSLYRTLYPATYLDCHRFLSIPLGATNTGVLLLSSWAMVMAVVSAQHGRKGGMIGWLVLVLLCSMGFLGIKAVEYSSKFREGLWVGDFNYAKANREWIKEEKGDEGEPFAQTPLAAIPGAAPMTGADTAKLYHHEAKRVFPYYPTVQELAADYRYTTPDTKELTKTEAGVYTSYTGPPSAVETASKRAQLFFSIYFGMTGLHALHIIIGMMMMLTIIGLRLKDHPSVTLDYMPTELVGLYWHFVDLVWIFLFPLMYLIS